MLTARARLTIVYIGLVLAAGIALSVLTYFLMRQNLGQRLIHVVTTSPGAGVPPPLPDLAERTASATLSALLGQAGIALAVVTVLAAVVGWLVAGRVLRPIRTISATAARLSAENLSERVTVTAPADELAALAGTINGMLDRIERGLGERDRALDSQRMFTANAAHELRTPLTTMRTAIDVTLDGEPGNAELVAMAGDIRTAVDHVQRTLDGLLALARSQIGPDRPQPVDLATIAAGALDGMTRHDVTVRTELASASVSGAPVLLERLVGNLVDNAVRYNHAGGHVTITTGSLGAHAFLRVVNTGRPISADQAETLLEPFVRGEPGRTDGAGLGLSIVRAVVLAHCGEIETIAPPSGGLDVTVRLPKDHTWLYRAAAS